MHGCGDHRARHAQAFGDMAFHLRAENQFRLQPDNMLLDFQVIIRDQRLHIVEFGGLAQLAGEFPRIGTEADDREAELLGGDSCRGDRMRGVAKDEHALAGQVIRIDRPGVPGQSGGFRRQDVGGIDTDDSGDLQHEITGRAHTDRHGFHHGLAEHALQPHSRLGGDFRVQDHVEIGIAKPGQVRRRRTQRGHDIDVDAHPVQQGSDLPHIVAVAESERCRTQQVAARANARLARRALAARRRRRRPGHGADELVEGFRRPPILLALIGRQFQRHDGDRQSKRSGQAARIILDQFSGAGGADEHRLRLESVEGFLRRGLEEFGGIAAEVAGLEGRVGNRRALGGPLDHGEQQIGIGVALRRMQHIMDTLHRRGDPHRADMGGAFIGPDSELHRSDLQPGAADQRPGK